MKRYLILVFLLLAATACGGGGGRKGGDGNTADSLAASAPEKPAPVARLSGTDTLSQSNNKGRLPQEPIFDIVTTMGTIRVKLYKDTPKHRNNFTRLALSHYYDDVLFHRVIPGFMIQGGDPYTRDTSRIEEWGEGGPGYTIDAEILPEHRHRKGALAAARRGNLANPMRESSGSQFYLVQDSTGCRHLNGEYTVFGETVGGLNVIDRIAHVQTDRFDHPLNPVRILRIRPNDELNRRALEEEQRAEETVESIETVETSKPAEKEAPKKSGPVVEEFDVVSETPPDTASTPRRRRLRIRNK
jgi:cyclophilin family peptidyl-prolyl cis-trans isomerase